VHEGFLNYWVCRW